MPGSIVSKLRSATRRSVNFALDTWDRAAHQIHLFAQSKEIQIEVKVFNDRLEFVFGETVDIGQAPHTMSPYPHAPHIGHHFERLLSDLEAMGCTSFNRRDAHGQPWKTLKVYTPTHGNLPMQVVKRVGKFAKSGLEKTPIFTLHPTL